MHFLILRERKQARIPSLSFFMAGLLSDAAFEPGSWPLPLCFSADDNYLCSSDSFIVGAFKRDAHYCSEGGERPQYYSVFSREQRGVEPRPWGRPLWKWHKRQQVQTCLFLASFLSFWALKWLLSIILSFSPRLSVTSCRLGLMKDWTLTP